VTERDTTPPILQNVPTGLTAEATGPTGATVTFQAPTATDVVDGPVAVTCAPTPGSTVALGSTTVTCSATDKAGNTASRPFTVTVQDTTPPSLSLPANMTAEATGPAGAVVSYTATAADAVDGSRPVTCSPASGLSFTIGTTTVTCVASDTRGNTATGSFTVTVQDTTKPSLTLPATITAEATGFSGAAVTYSVGATDVVDGAVTVTCSSASSSPYALGTTTVICTATDAHGNTASGSFTVTVVDTTPPVLTLPAPITAEATDPGGALVSYTASDTDVVDGAVAVSCSPASDATFAMGTTTVTCAVTDAHGNTAKGSFTVKVFYDWDGFFRPVENDGVVNQVKAGSAIPVKFSLNGDWGLNIFVNGYPKWVMTSCTTWETTNPVDETVTAGSSSLSYDATADQYVYVWKTDKAWAGSCRQLNVMLRDGIPIHWAKFRFTK
jgi:hypothetical protein